MMLLAIMKLLLETTADDLVSGSSIFFKHGRIHLLALGVQAILDAAFILGCDMLQHVATGTPVVMVTQLVIGDGGPDKM
jgi:hypothetical protein